MIEKARARGAYDELVVQELVGFMGSRPAAFDAIVSADTLVYFGSLAEPLAAARMSLRQGGIFVFTLERLEAEEGFRLEPHGRYSHSERYVRETATLAGFRDLQFETRVLRRERGAEVMGHVILAR
jgi:predicted TPR repeat methyltransferase